MNLHREKAKEITGGCTCGMLEGFAWKGVHRKDCVVELIAQALADARKWAIEDCAKFVDSPDFYIKPREQRAKAIRKLAEE